MPEDVLEQFILDHGLNPAFQKRYGDLDLYALSWTEEQLSTTHIIRCTSKFDHYVQEVAVRHSKAITVKDAVFHPEARPVWSEQGTWLRPPLFFRDVFPAPDEHHLIEGHTRVGALVGFHRNLHSPVTLSATHACWVGRLATQPRPFDWQTVRRQHPLSFKRWIYDAMGDDGPVSRLAMALVDAEHKSRSSISVGDDLPDLIRLIERVPVAGLTATRLEELYAQWTQDVGL